MADNKKVLKDTMTLLMSITPETSLGQLLQLCLAAKVDANLGKSSSEMADELLNDPSKIAYWTMDVIGSDANYTPAELKALDEMKLSDPDSFVADFQSELQSLNLS